MNESYGMKKYDKKMGGNYYGMREKDSMLKEDRSKHSHMPTEVIMKSYPRQDYIMQDYGDSLYSTDMYANETVRGANKQKAHKKY